MISTGRLIKVALAWMSLVYAVCFFGVALFPGIRTAFMKYSLHVTGFQMGQNFMTFGSFISGLIIWDLIAVLAVWLFAALWNRIR